MATTVREWLRSEVSKVLNGASSIETLPEKSEKLTFINDQENINKAKLREYNVWYQGDARELLNFYSYHTAVTSNMEPWEERNSKSFFWSVSATEQDIKRTHSGQAKNIIDTMTAIVGVPDIAAGSTEVENDPVDTRLKLILKENKFAKMCRQIQLPMTMTEGYGCYKIWWDTNVCDYPIISYYRAEDVDFVYRRHRIVGVIFRDYYTVQKGGSTKNYMIAEIRYLKNKKMYLETKIFDITDGELDSPVIELDPAVDEIPEELCIDKDSLKYEVQINKLFAVPCVFYTDNSGMMHGRSILAGKIELLDDLDQCLSQAAMAVRRSTPVEYVNSKYLERDRNGLPLQPSVFDRKYVLYDGPTTADGTAIGANPIQATQPNINFEQYDKEAVAILLQIVNGLISPATLGMDVAKKDNAEAQREKEKITIFTRDHICSTETEIIQELCEQLLIADELIRNNNNITKTEYDIHVMFPEFGEDTYEGRIKVLGEQLDKDNVSVNMYLKKLYGNKLKGSEYENERKYLEERHKPVENEGPDEEELQDSNFEDDEIDQGMQGAFEKQNLVK